MKWETVRLGDIATNFFYGSMPRKDDLSDSGYPVFSGYRVVGYSKKYNIKNDTLVVIARGVGGTGDVKIAPAKSFLTNLSIAVELNESIVNQEFLYFLLKYQGLRYLDTGAAQSQITIASLRTHKVSLPDMRTQKKIGQFLSTYDDLIENNQQQIKLLEEAAQRLYKEWFVDLRFPGYETAKIVDGVPEGWRKGAITDLLEIRYGKDHKALENGDIPVYGSGGVMRRVNRILYSGESVLIPRKGSLNNIMYVTGDFWTIDTMFYSEPRLENVAKYSYLFLSGLDMYSYNIGAAVPSMTVKILDGIELLQPSEDILDQFEKKVSPLFDRQGILQQQSETAKQARDRLLPKLMSGELEV